MSQRNEFTVGEIVDIHITDAQVVNAYGTRQGHLDGTHEDTGTVLVVKVDSPERDSRSVAVNLASPAVNVIRRYPAEWPPRPGDLWREVDGALWFAQSLGGSQMALIPASVRGSLDSALPAHVQEMYGPLTLAHREGGAQ